MKFHVDGFCRVLRSVPRISVFEPLHALAKTGAYKLLDNVLLILELTVGLLA